VEGANDLDIYFLIWLVSIKSVD